MKFEIGDIVVSACNPTCVQRVVKIAPLIIGGVERKNDPMLSCVTIWRFDGSPISTKPNKPAAAWAYRKAMKKELRAAITRLEALIESTNTEEKA